MSINEIILYLGELYSDYQVVADGVLYIFFITLFKVVLSSNKRSRNVATNVTNKSAEIDNIKETSEETLELIRNLKTENETLRSHIETIEHREDILGNMLKSFVKYSGINVEGKLDIAKMYDSFKSTLNIGDGEPAEQEIITVENKQKQKEIDEFNKKHGIDEEDTVGRRRLTNVGVFRKYIEEYLYKHPKIHPDKPPYIVMVRHLQPTERGLPIQVYGFSKEYSWKQYEQAQADIFYHILK